MNFKWFENGVFCTANHLIAHEDKSNTIRNAILQSMASAISTVIHPISGTSFWSFRWDMLASKLAKNLCA
jgi:Na+-transporting NADH:ubiquinone oxidoreductase subunit NqrC